MLIYSLNSSANHESTIIKINVTPLQTAQLSDSKSGKKAQQYGNICAILIVDQIIFKSFSFNDFKEPISIASKPITNNTFTAFDA